MKYIVPVTVSIVIVLASFAATPSTKDPPKVAHSEQGNAPALLIIEGSMLTDTGELLQPWDWLCADTLAFADEDTILVSGRQVLTLPAGTPIAISQAVQPTYVSGCICCCGWSGGECDVTPVIPSAGESCASLNGDLCFPPGGGNVPIPSLYNCVAGYVPGVPVDDD